MAECTNCEVSMDSKASGLRALLSTTSIGGYECANCGAILCEDCKRDKVLNAIGGNDISCGVCGGRLKQR